MDQKECPYIRLKVTFLSLDISTHAIYFVPFDNRLRRALLGCCNFRDSFQFPIVFFVGYFQSAYSSLANSLPVLIGFLLPVQRKLTDLFV